MNWSNIDLTDNYEASQNIIDPLSFSTLLLEIGCNIREINEKSVSEQFEIDLQSRIQSAREIFRDNLKNITAHAIRERNEP